MFLSESHTSPLTAIAKLNRAEAFGWFASPQITQYISKFVKLICGRFIPFALCNKSCPLDMKPTSKNLDARANFCVVALWEMLIFYGMSKRQDVFSWKLQNAKLKTVLSVFLFK